MKIRILSTVIVAVLALAGAPQAAESSRLLDLMAGKEDTGNTIVLAADVACAPPQVYALWATPDGAKASFAPDAKIGEGIGGQYTIVFFPPDDPAGVRHGTLGAHVLATDPGHFYSFEWVVFAGDDTKGNNAPPYAPETLRRPAHLPTWVELTFTRNAAGTHVEFRHFGFGDTPLWKRSQAWFTRAWGGVLQGMKQYCEKHA